MSSPLVGRAEPLTCSRPVTRRAAGSASSDPASPRAPRLEDARRGDPSAVAACSSAILDGDVAEPSPVLVMSLDRQTRSCEVTVRDPRHRGYLSRRLSLPESVPVRRDRGAAGGSGMRLWFGYRTTRRPRGAPLRARLRSHARAPGPPRRVVDPARRLWGRVASQAYHSLQGRHRRVRMVIIVAGGESEHLSRQCLGFCTATGASTSGQTPAYSAQHLAWVEGRGVVYAGRRVCVSAAREGEEWHAP